MLAVKGIYDNGKVLFETEVPNQIESTEVIVVFPDNGEKELSKGLSL